MSELNYEILPVIYINFFTDFLFSLIYNDFFF